MPLRFKFHGRACLIISGLLREWNKQTVISACLHESNKGFTSMCLNINAIGVIANTISIEILCQGKVSTMNNYYNLW